MAALCSNVRELCQHLKRDHPELSLVPLLNVTVLMKLRRSRLHFSRAVLQFQFSSGLQGPFFK